MKFSAQEQINAPVEDVFAKVANVDHFESLLINRGDKIIRSPENSFGVGTTWDARVTMRGKTRKVTMEMIEYTQNECMGFQGGTTGMDILVIMDTMALTPNRTRLKLQIEAKPKTLAARLLIQSAKLAKGRLDKRFKDRFSDYAQGLLT